MASLLKEVPVPPLLVEPLFVVKVGVVEVELVLQTKPSVVIPVPVILVAPLAALLLVMLLGAVVVSVGIEDVAVPVTVIF